MIICFYRFRMQLVEMKLISVGDMLDLKIQKGRNGLLILIKLTIPIVLIIMNILCPIVPLENDLAVEINAGVKKFHD